MTATELRMTVADLRIELAGGGAIVEEFKIELRPGEIVGLVGESGSGKTSSALAMLGYHKRGVEITSADIRLGNVRVTVGERARDIRGRLISYVPQEPGPALNPSLRIADAINEVVRAHLPERLGPHTATEMLELVGLPRTAEFSRRFPHQLSGGQQQRVCIALALACEPSVVVLDEPTTGLDVLTQARILRELTRLRDQRRVAMLYVTHNLAVVAQIADRIMVMYAGRIIEEGPAHEVLAEPKHPYTRGLLAATPDHLHPRPLEAMPGVALGVGDRRHGCAFAPRCPQRVTRCEEEIPPLESISDGRTVRCFRWETTRALDESSQTREAKRPSSGATPALEVESLHAEYATSRGSGFAVTDVSFKIEQGTCLALVGESGSGKTTIARVLAGLHPTSGGHIRLFGEVLSQKRTRDQFRRVQLIFQSPADALNPRHTVQYTIGRPAHVLRGLSERDCATEANHLLELVRLPSRLAKRYPTELSGGERQRVAVARALAAQPDLIICDEITSALDVSVQAAIIALLRDLQHDLHLSMLFITHDLGIVAAIADRVLILDQGTVCEEALTMELLRAPKDEYTRRLIEAAPSIAQVTEGLHTSSMAP